MTDTNKVQRWTGLVEANDGGGFVAVGDYIALRAENERLKDALASAEKDAARYRFMRDADRSDENCPYEQMLMYAMESLDEAIDAAMENKQ